MACSVVRALAVPPMWPRIDFRTRRHMWVEFVGSSRPCFEGFFFEYAGFPLPEKLTFDLEFEGDRFVSRTTVKGHPCLTKFIYLFLLNMIIL